jgi:hypothetical protein
MTIRPSPDDDSRRPSPWHDFPGWIALAWTAWWSFAYVRSALAHRFPHLLGWLGR